MVFRGTWEYTIDDRGRVPIPARYREAFVDGLVLVEGLDGCLEVYTQEGYERWAQFVASRGPHKLTARRIRRGVCGRSFDGELDAQGRILIPARSRQYAALEGPVTIVGREECLEVWSRQRWEAEEALVEQEYRRDLESMEDRP